MIEASQSPPGERNCRTDVMHVFCRPVKALGLHPFITAVAQLVGTYGLGILMTLSAYAGYSVLAIILEVAELYKEASQCAVPCNSGHACNPLHAGSPSCLCPHTLRRMLIPWKLCEGQ